MIPLPQIDPDALNAEFWDYVCGAQQKAQRGKDFDAWFFRYYPWIEKWVPFDSLQGKTVLEVGIGSGTTARRLAGIAGEMHALDVARGPLDLLLKESEHEIAVQQGSILEAPYASGFFDYVVSIGCIHHTGDPRRALSEIHRILKLGGGTTIMVYHRGSGKREIARDWDKSTSGEGPPFTEWFTIGEVLEMLEKAGFSNATAEAVNARSNGVRGLNVYASGIA